MKFRNTFIMLSVLGSVVPQVAFGMLAEEGDAIPHIVIPSDPDVIGIDESAFFDPWTQLAWSNSWNDLNSFTNQTIENFSQGILKGMCYVHSLEDIMGATKCFTRNWNMHHHEDQRHPRDKNFHEVFTPHEYVDHYIDYVLAHRPLISGSVLAFNDNPGFTLSDSFAPVSFIMHVPPQCIGVIDRKDAGTPVWYLSQKNEDFSDKLLAPYLKKMLRTLRKSITLDALVRYPNIQGAGESYLAEMNEVAILNCVKGKDGALFKPSIVGVLFNPSFGTMKMDYGNAVRNVEWGAAAEAFCARQNLPFLALNPCELLSQQTVEATVVQEWFGQEKSLNSYFFDRDSEEGDSPSKDWTFMLSDEQLAGYHLKR